VRVIDTEHALDPGYAKKIGVDIDNLLVSQPDSGEEALIIADQLIRSNSLDVIVVDSVAALAPRAELEGQIGDSHVGLQARLMSQAMRKMTGILDKSKTVCIFTNQIREKIGVMFGKPRNDPRRPRPQVLFLGPPRHPPHRRHQGRRRQGCRQPHPRQGREEQGGPALHRSRVRHPLRRGHFKEGAVIDAANDLGLLDKRGTWLSFDGQQIGQGRDAARDNLKQDPALLAKIRDAVVARHAEHGSKPSGKEVGAKTRRARSRRLGFTPRRGASDRCALRSCGTPTRGDSRGRFRPGRTGRGSNRRSAVW
jgi:recombination protein RecA